MTYQIGPLLQPLLDQFFEEFVTITVLEHTIHPIDYIMNRSPRFEIGLSLDKWKQAWQTRIHVLGEIDRLSHPGEQFDEDEPNPGDALNQPPSQHSQITETI